MIGELWPGIFMALYGIYALRIGWLNYRRKYQVLDFLNAFVIKIQYAYASKERVRKIKKMMALVDYKEIGFYYLLGGTIGSVAGFSLLIDYYNN